VFFKALSSFQNIKPVSAKANYLIRPFQDNNNYSSLVSGSLVGSKPAVSSELEQIDTVTT